MDIFKRLLKRGGDGHYMTLRELQGETGIKQGTLYMAIITGRLRAYKSADIWLSTVAAVQEAIAAGRLNPPAETK